MAVLLNKFEDMSYAEIAEVMSRSPAAVKSLLAQGPQPAPRAARTLLATGQRGREWSPRLCSPAWRRE